MAKTKTFLCVCGHLAYYIKYRGWCCMCNNPRTYEQMKAESDAFWKPKGFTEPVKSSKNVKPNEDFL